MRLRGLTAGQRSEASEQIRTLLDRSPVARQARRLGAYAALGREVSLDGWLERRLQAGVRLALPVAGGSAPHLRYVEALGDLRAGPAGAREPPPESVRAATANLDLVLLPGLAFDEEGGRLGRGAGFYDRLLASPAGSRPDAGPGPTLLGVCFAVQIVPCVPEESHDVRVHGCVSELGLRWFRP